MNKIIAHLIIMYNGSNKYLLFNPFCTNGFSDLKILTIKRFDLGLEFQNYDVLRSLKILFEFSKQWKP